VQSIAAAIGTCIGYAIGHILRIAGPELKAFLTGIIRDALKDSAEVGKPNIALDNAWTGGLPDKPRAPDGGTNGN